MVSVASISAFAAVYPNPKAAFNLMGFIGYGKLSVDIEGEEQDIGDIGGLVFGVDLGLDPWVSPSWSLGPHLQLVQGFLSGEEDGVTASDNWTSVTLTFAATYN